MSKRVKIFTKSKMFMIFQTLSKVKIIKTLKISVLRIYVQKLLLHRNAQISL